MPIDSLASTWSGRSISITVLYRLMVSGSDRHASSWQQAFKIAGVEELTLDHAYKAMAWLGEGVGEGRTNTEAIEEALYRYRRPLFGQVSVAFYDTTTLWFEGRGGAHLGRREHSKDYRPHLAQVVLGIVLDETDRPIASFLWPGNTADVTTLMLVVERLRTRFGIDRACIVADRGMISAATMAELEAKGVEYILGVRERSTGEVRNDVMEDDGVAVPLAIPRQKGETQLEIKDVTIASRRYVLCRNEEEASKDAVARAELLAGLERKLAQGDKALVANTGFRRFLRTLEMSTSPSTTRRANKRPSSMGSPYCAPTANCLRCRSCFAIGICWRWKTPSRPPRPCPPLVHLPQDRRRHPRSHILFVPRSCCGTN